MNTVDDVNGGRKMATIEELRTLLAKVVAWRDLDENYDRSICVKCNCVNITESDDELTPFCYACAQEMINALLDVAEAAIRVTKWNAAKRRHARASQAEIDLAKAVAKLKVGSTHPMTTCLSAPFVATFRNDVTATTAPCPEKCGGVVEAGTSACFNCGANINVKSIT
jgi:hypothetical protein